MLYHPTLPFAALVATAFAAPQGSTIDCPSILCVDGINDCGVGWGGCFDVCQPELSPTPPDCPVTTPAPSYSAAGPIPTDDCSTRTVCADYINECGIWYGGCFSDCTPWPTFTAPPCPDNTTLVAYPVISTDETITVTAFPDTSTDFPEITTDLPDTSTDFPEIITDLPDTSTDFPEIITDTDTDIDTTTELPDTATDLPDTSTDFPEIITDTDIDTSTDFPETITDLPDISTDFPEIITDTDIDTSTDFPEIITDTDIDTSTDFPVIITDFPTTTTFPEITSTDDCSTRTVCADYINDCGIWYGGCFADCTPWPTFTAPPCPSTTTLVEYLGVSTDDTVTLTTPPSITSIFEPSPTWDCSTETVCEDLINACGQTFGGCFSACLPWPTFTPPPCGTTCVTSTKVCTSGISEGITTTWGGCFDAGEPQPTFTEPICPYGWELASVWATDTTILPFPTEPTAFISETITTTFVEEPTDFTILDIPTESESSPTAFPTVLP